MKLSPDDIDKAIRALRFQLEKAGDVPRSVWLTYSFSLRFPDDSDSDEPVFLDGGDLRREPVI